LQVSVHTPTVLDPPAVLSRRSRCPERCTAWPARHTDTGASSWWRGSWQILAVVSLGLLSRGTTVDNFSVPGTQSQQALTQLEQALPTLAAPSTQVTFAVPVPAKKMPNATGIVTGKATGNQVRVLNDADAAGVARPCWSTRRRSPACPTGRSEAGS
jgi:hypothetical protein